MEAGLIARRPIGQAEYALSGKRCQQVFLAGKRSLTPAGFCGIDCYMKNRALKIAIESAGSINALARKLGISGQAVQQWRRVPAERVVEVEKATGVPRAQLRPDIFA